jgi:transposase
MEHVAIDLGSRESQVCIRDEKGTIVLERRMRTQLLGGFLRKRPASLVAMETCTEAFGVADKALELGHQVRVVPATLVRALGVGARGIKTDVRDARVLSEASVRMDLPTVHIPTMSSREGKSICNARSALVGARTKLINVARATMRGMAVQVPAGSAETFPARLEKAWKASSELQKSASAPSTTSEDPWEALAIEALMAPHLRRLAQAIESLSELIVEADQELEQRVKADPVAQRLMTVPGVGPVCATRFVTTLDNAQRFQSAEQLQSYLGLSPGEKQSGDRQKRTQTIKCGAEGARAALVQSAWCMWRTRKNDPIVQWAQGVEKRRGKQIAITALARKLATVLFTMWRTQTPYDASRPCRSRAEQDSRTTQDESKQTERRATRGPSRRMMEREEANSTR